MTKQHNLTERYTTVTLNSYFRHPVALVFTACCTQIGKHWCGLSLSVCHVFDIVFRARVSARSPTARPQKLNHPIYYYCFLK